MKVLRNHNASIAACYGGYACLAVLTGPVAEACFYGLVGALHALAARHEGAAKAPHDASGG